MRGIARKAATYRAEILILRPIADAAGHRVPAIAHLLLRGICEQPRLAECG